MRFAELPKGERVRPSHFSQRGCSPGLGVWVEWGVSLWAVGVSTPPIQGCFHWGVLCAEAGLTPTAAYVDTEEPLVLVKAQPL